jgi:serine/threonine protein kinase/tetratricopeptide (TPR) repeat protein
MPELDTCPEIMELEQFALRELDEPACAQVESHLLRCSLCAGQVSELRENLRIAPALKRNASSFDLDVPAEQQPETIGPYRILRKLGQGGMGTVYEAQQENPRRVVAVKVIRPGIASAAIAARFRHEAQVLGRLQHPGIAQIYEAGKHDSPRGAQSYLVMELVHGRPLLQYADENRLDVRRRLELLARICDAVHHAHQRGVIHRDLKPDNILVEAPTSELAEATPKILDFGVARVVDPDNQAATTMLTSAGQIIGTIAYMSPEQVSANPAEIDTRSDVYALGVIAYQLLCGQLPYKLNPASVVQAAQVITHDEPPPLATVVRSLQGDVTTIVGKALEKDKTRRYQSAAEMAADIRRHLRDEPISAHPPSTIYQLRKFARRNRGLVAGVAAAFVVLVFGVVGTTIGMVRARHAQHDAETSAADARRETAKANAVNQFLNDMIASASPTERTLTDQAKGPKVTMLEVLNEASRKLDGGSLKDQPAIEAAVRRTIGQSYGALGQFANAESHLRAAMALDQTLYGAAHPELAVDQMQLAVTLHAAGRLDEAESLYRQSMQIRTKAFGPDARELADSINGLAAVARDRGNLAEADELFSRALAIRRKALGEEHRLVASDMDQLAVVREKSGRFAEAEDLDLRALTMRRKLLGDDHPEVAASLNSLATLYYQQRNFDAAEAACREALSIRRKLFGDDHTEVGSTMNTLAAVLHQQKKYDEAEQMLRRVIELKRKALGDDHEDVSLGLNNLAMMLMERGKLAEAEDILRRVLDLERKQKGSDHPQVATTLNNLAGALREQGKLVECEPLFRESLEIRRKRLGEDHPEVAFGMYNYASLLRDLKRTAEAEPYHRRALAIMEAKLGPKNPSTQTLRAGLGGCLMDLGRLDEAEPLLAEALPSLRTSLGDPHKSTIRIASRLITIYEAQGKTSEADALRPILAATQPSTTVPTQ